MVQAAQSYIIEYVKKPADPVWAFTVNSVGGYVYASGSSTDFEISDVDQTELILKILMYAGVIVRDPGNSTTSCSSCSCTRLTRTKLINHAK